MPIFLAPDELWGIWSLRYQKWWIHKGQIMATPDQRLAFAFAINLRIERQTHRPLEGWEARRIGENGYPITEED